VLLRSLVAESAKKSRVCWLSWPGSTEPRLVWHAWYDDALLVLSGDEQPLPGIEMAAAGSTGTGSAVIGPQGTVQVTMRSKDTGGRLLTWTGTVEVVDPATGSWDENAAALLAVRLNLPDPPETLAAWRQHATIVRITPVDATGEPEVGALP
jgi:hypothetical protein